MAELHTLARPYAKAVFELARDEGRLGEWSSELASIEALLEEPRMAELIGHPAVGRAELSEALSAVLAGRISAQGLALLRLLVGNGRLRVVGSLLRQFEALKAEHESRASVEIATAVAVDAPGQKALADAIAKRLSRQVEIVWRTDESLVAGALITAGDLVIDGSVRGELERMRARLAQ